LDTITEALKETLNNAAAQFIEIAVIIAGVYIIAYLILSFVRVPKVFRNFISAIITAIVGYYAYIGIFLSV